MTRISSITAHATVSESALKIKIGNVLCKSSRSKNEVKRDQALMGFDFDPGQLGYQWCSFSTCVCVC